MNPNEMDLVVNYLISRLDPQGQEDVKEILGGGDLPDPAQDALTKGGFALQRWPKRLRTRAILAEKSKPGMAADSKPETPAERTNRLFPHANRLKV